MREIGRALVTGADGFIGSHLVDTLLAEGAEVTALCLYNSNGQHGWLEPYVSSPAKGLRLVLGDVRDPYFMTSLAAGHDTVFHLASLIAIPYSYEAPASYVQTNVGGALSVAEACKAQRVGRLVHTSTSEVYGTAERVPIDETHPLKPQSPYSASKIGADALVESYWRSFGLPAVTLRPFNTFGPRQSLRAVLATIAAQLLSGDGKVRLGNVTPTRDFVFVADTVRAFLAIARADDAVLGQAFNAATGREISIRDAALAVGGALGKHVVFEVEDARKRPEKSEVQRLLGDPRKLEAATGWTATVTFDEGIHALCTWMTSRGDLGRAHAYQK